MRARPLVEESLLKREEVTKLLTEQISLMTLKIYSPKIIDGIKLTRDLMLLRTIQAMVIKAKVSHY